MSASTHNSTEQQIAEEAAVWLIELEDDDADLAGFAAWLEASPRHVEEFLLCSAVWRAADGMDEARRVDVEALLAQARAVVHRLGEDTLPAPAMEVRPRLARVLHGPLSAAAVLLAIVGVTFISLSNDVSAYATAVGEQRTVKLADGSIVTINTRSQIKVRMEEHQRTIELIRGEALFDVAHDKARPFRVLSGETVVQAVGTQFNVNRKPDATTVSVVEGIVEVAPRNSRTHPAERLLAGEQAQISTQGELLQHAVADIDRILAWRERRLVFRNESLGAIAAEFNRYNDRQLQIEGAATSARQITAVFDADNPDALIAFLERDPQLSVQTSGDTVVIRGP